MNADALLFSAACVSVALIALAWLSTNVSHWGRCMSPIILPPAADLSWKRARQIVDAFRANGRGNPIIVAAVANGYAEAAWEPVIVGDHGQSFGPWQMKKQFYAAPIKAALGIDITDKATTLEQHVEAVLYALGHGANAPILAALDAAKTGEDATRIWAAQFERASAGGAVERRVAIAPQVEVWLSKQT